MANDFRGNAGQVKAGLAEEGIKYGISIGRRAPMHKMHADCIQEIIDAGLTPVIFIGSTNGPQSQYYDPLSNPLTVEQQKAQMKLAFPKLDVDNHVIACDDVGKYEQWCDSVSAAISRTGLAGKAVAHFRSKSADAGASGAIKPLSSYRDGFIKRGLPVWESFNRSKVDDAINASELRQLDLKSLSTEQEKIFADPDYIIHIAKEARAHNPARAELEANNIPLTMLDLTFDRLHKEAGVETVDIIKAARSQGKINITSLTKATQETIKKLHTREQDKPAKPGVELKVASVSLNQTVQNFTRNVPNILSAIDHAVADKADILSLQELVLTGYTGDDNFKWIRSDQQQKELVELLQYIADYAKKRDPNMVMSVGFPFFYADKKQPVKLNVGTDEKPALVDNPLYNINNKPFNAVAIISGGKIQAISAKSIQPEGAAEYEPRQFLSWPDYLGVKEVTLYNGEKVPFGKVIAQLGKDNGKSATVYHEICAEAWPGISDDGTLNLKEQREARHLSHLVKTHDISLVINPSASKPEPFLDKAELRKKLCVSGSEITNGGGYVYTNVNGLEAAPIAFEGGSIFANKGEIVHSGERYGMADVIYNSAPMQLPAPEKGTPHIVIPHEFRHHDGQKKGSQANWESKKGNERVYEELVRNTGLWLRDYLKKSGQQGFFISLSGGQDSAFGAIAITKMIGLNISQLEQSLGSKEKAVAAFVDQFDGLKYADKVKQVTHKQGAEAGIAYLKSQMLTCAYFPSENSSKDTENAARILIEGGALPDGKKVKGIGGTFHIVPVQDIVESYVEIFAGADKTGLSPDKKERLRKEVKECIKGERETVSDEFKDNIKRRILSWKNKGDDVTLQNIQARVRLPAAWLFGNDESKIACVTSNWSESVAGYWTFGGDGHMGSINVLGGIPKSDLRQLLTHLETKGIAGYEPIPALHYINQNKASAELRPLKNGKIIQFDEDDMMPYEALDAIARKIIIGKNSPVDAYKQLWAEQPKFSDSKPVFDSKERLIADIEQCCSRWHASQFKRVAAVITPFLGQNVDPHTAVRTTIMSDGFMTGRAALKMEYLKDKLGGEQEFEQAIGKPFNKTLIELKISGNLRQAVLNAPLDKLEETVKNIAPYNIDRTNYGNGYRTH